MVVFVFDDQVGQFQFFGVVVGEDGLQILLVIGCIIYVEVVGDFIVQVVFFVIFDGMW